MSEDLHSPALRWLDPHSRGRYLEPAELADVRAALGDFGRSVVAAWVSADGKTMRFARECATVDAARDA